MWVRHSILLFPLTVPMPSKVLVIDNNLDIIQLLKDKLPDKGFEVRFASNGEEGLSLAKSFKPDVIFLDILNPEVSGFETLKKLKNDDDTAGIPVILDSIVENYKEKALQMGAVDFLSKPINMDKLYSCVEKALGSERAVAVIDDEPAIVEMTKDFLESKGLRAYGALSGSNGVSLLQKEHIGVIILDLKMPGMDGYEVIKIIKDNPLTCDIPIIVVTSVDIDECKEKCLMLGADECMRKPFNGEVLIQQVNNMLNRTIRKEKQYMDFSKGRILIADDEESILSMVSDILELQGYELILAHDGQEALDKIYSENPDLVILDVNMPHKDGYEVCTKIREDILMANLPIIMLTARTTEKDEIRGLELGVDDYLTKPVRPSVLIARVRAALSRIQQGVNVNPLTYLPGNTSIAREIERRLKNEEIAPLSTCRWSHLGLCRDGLCRVGFKCRAGGVL